MHPIMFLILKEHYFLFIRSFLFETVNSNKICDSILKNVCLYIIISHDAGSYVTVLAKQADGSFYDLNE